MQRNRRRWLNLAAILLLLAVPSPHRLPTPPRLLRQLHVPAGLAPETAGAAELPLPVPEDVHLAGYGPLRTAKGVRDAPMARALVIGPWAIVALDLLEVSPELAAAIRERLPATAALFVVATHTHSGPGGTDPNLLAQLLGEGPFHRARLEAFAEVAAKVVASARANARPAIVTVAHAEAPQLQEERDPGGTLDPGLTVLRAQGQDGAAIGTVAVFGAHPTLLPRKERLLSADWPGAAVRELEKGGGVALVLQGAGGDASVPRPGLPDDPGERIQAYGERFAAATRSAQPTATQPIAGCDFASAEVTLPAPNLSRFLPGPLHGAFDWFVDWLLPSTAEVSVARLGPVVFYCLPGELTGAAHALEGLAFEPGQRPIALGLCNGDVSYIESPALWRSGRGERLALFGPDLAERLFAGVRSAAMAAKAAPH